MDVAWTMRSCVSPMFRSYLENGSGGEHPICKYNSYTRSDNFDA